MSTSIYTFLHPYIQTYVIRYICKFAQNLILLCQEFQRYQLFFLYLHTTITNAITTTRTNTSPYKAKINIPLMGVVPPPPIFSHTPCHIPNLIASLYAKLLLSLYNPHIITFISYHHYQNLIPSPTITTIQILLSILFTYI